MKKKLIVFSCIAAFLAASAAMLVWLRYSAGNISVLQQAKTDLMFLTDPAISLRYIRYYEDTRHFDIHCRYSGMDGAFYYSDKALFTEKYPMINLAY